MLRIVSNFTRLSVATLILAGCGAGNLGAGVLADAPPEQAVPALEEISPSVSPLESSPTPGSSAVLPTPTPPRSLMSAADFTTLWIDPAIPPGLRSSLVIPVDVYPAESKEGATLRFEPGEGMGEVNWVFALTVPFPTIIDQVSLEDVQNAWRGKDGGAFGKIPLLVSPATLLAFSSLWGAPAPEGVRILDDTELLDAAWGEMPSWAIVPFENLSPRWKVLRVNGLTPLDNNFHLEYYPLTVKFTLTGELALQKEITYLNTNRDPEKLTTLVMTGVTALVRSTAAKMEKLGMGYPARDIGTWLEAADLTHVSNEVSFVAECPPANPYQKTLMFCSRPEYIDLLKQSGVDIVELTGNHLVDWRRSALVESLALYQEYEMHTYGSGKNLEEARQPLLVEHNGNRLAFLGCNPAGPEAVWATEDLAGAAPCDYEWMKGEIGRLRAEGYLPIVTLQYFESYSFTPTPGEQRDFPPLAEAGAVIVSGSQAHYPQGMAFIGDGFVHYGLGNLFFDQMYMPVEGTEADKTLPGTRKEFIDRHVFYDGRYIGVELLTALLEDFAKPRPMTMEERVEMLTSAFENSSW